MDMDYPPMYKQAKNILSGLKKCPLYQRRMEYTMLSLKAILKNAEEKQEHDHHLRNWLEELQNVFSQIESYLEEIIEGPYKQGANGKQVFVPFLYSSRKEHTWKMKKLCDQLDAIAYKMYEFNLTEMETTHFFLSATQVSTQLMKPTWQLLYPLINVPKAYHNDRYKDALDNFKKPDHRLFHIVGEAGVGKSTLAKFFYNDPDIEKKFTSRLWVCVKEEFDTQRLMREILSFSCCPTTSANLTLKQLWFTVQQYLREKTFLLVFQDLSMKNLDNPSMFTSLLGMGEPSSKIIVTTQNREIADVLKNPYAKEIGPEATEHSNINKNEESIQVNHIKDQTIFKVERLSEENSWSLFKDYAGDEEEAKKLDPKITELIEQKCKGVPLAIKCLGALLFSTTSIVEQNNVINKLRAQNEEEDGSVLPTLKLCYHLMPSYLRKCFLYCSQLSNDRILSSNDVIQLWMAHELVLKENFLSLEKIGEQYFKELCSRCFLHEIEQYGLGYWFKLHPLIQKLAQELTQNQDFRVTKTKSIAFPVRDKVPPSPFLAEICISKFKDLELLYLGNTNLQKIPNAVGTLKQLKYLDLQENKRIKRLPNSICNLRNLQTLILASCSALEELPHDIQKLTNLRYLWVTANKLHLHKNGFGTMTSLRFLVIGGCDNLQDLFKQQSCLVRLETLMIYDCKTLRLLPEEMSGLISLQNLVIWSCKQLTLTLKEVEFRLRRFTIRGLPRVNELPAWLQTATETLRVLEIIDCPIEIQEDSFEKYNVIEKISIHGDVSVKSGTESNLQFMNFVRRREVENLRKIDYY